MKRVRTVHGLQELVTTPLDSKLWNKDLAATTLKQRDWNKYHIIALWVSLSVQIPTYMLGAGLISSGMNWWQALLTILLGNIIVAIPMIMIGHAGTKYGIPFPVFLRACFGTEGARIASLLRALVACGWFGIQTWIGGSAIYQLLAVICPAFKATAYLGEPIALNVSQLCCFTAFWSIQMLMIHHGMQTVKKLAACAAPLLILVGALLLGWVCIKGYSPHSILAASYLLNQDIHISIWDIFWPSLTGIIGFWATLALNITDFTRFARSQKDQIVGQIIGLPVTMTFYAFVGIFITSATILIFGKPIWDPVALFGELQNTAVAAFAMFSIGLATACCNIMANVISPANDFSNLWPTKISFRKGCYLTGIIGVLMCPWKLMADPQGYIFKWLLAYSSLLGAVGGIMLCDYYVLRRTKLNLYDLFASNGIYTYRHGWHVQAFIVFFIATLPNIPGFLVKTGILNAQIVPTCLINLYDYAWFISLGIAFILYYVIAKKPPQQEIYN